LNTYERSFFENVLEKTKAKNQAISQRGKGKGKTSHGLKTPYDYMSVKEKKNLNSEVRSFNMYEKIITKEEFFKQDREIQKNMMTKWRELYPNVEIMSQMGIRGNNAYHKLIKDLDIQAKKTRRKPAPTKREATVKKIQPSPVLPVTPVKEETAAAAQQAPIKIIINGLHLEYNGTYDADQLAKIFTKLQLLVDGESSDYYLTLTLTEEASSRREEKKDLFIEKSEKSSPELQEEARTWTENLG
jgi:hypothetical protein